MRGNLDLELPFPALIGSIPACAGEPVPCNNIGTFPVVYPRVCGGTVVAIMVGKSPEGLSPRVRGNPGRSAPAMPLSWSIPACAGEPARHAGGVGAEGVYPRVCGGTDCGSAFEFVC